MTLPHLTGAPRLFRNAITAETCHTLGKRTALHGLTPQTNSFRCMLTGKQLTMA